MITQDQYASMLARLDKNPKREALGEPVEKESDLHEFVRIQCANRGWIGFHGSMAHRTHRTIGEPDWIIIADKSRIFIIELKGHKTKVSPEQLALKLWAEKLGTVIHILRTEEEILNVFDS